MLAYDEKVPIHFWKIVIETGVLPSRDSKIRAAIVRIESPVNKLFPIENTYPHTN